MLAQYTINFGYLQSCSDKLGFMKVASSNTLKLTKNNLRGNNKTQKPKMHNRILKTRNSANRPPAGPRRKWILNSKTNVNFLTVHVPLRTKVTTWIKSERQEKRDGEEGKATKKEMPSGGKSHKWAHIHSSSGILRTSYRFTWFWWFNITGKNKTYLTSSCKVPDIN